MTDDLCWYCGEWGCDGSCADDPDRPCTFCGDPDCGGSGYNCADDYYQEYNLHGYEDSIDEEAPDAQH